MGLRLLAKTKADSLVEEQLEKLGEEPMTEWRRQCIVIGSDLGERNEHVACHASALAMTDDAC